MGHAATTSAADREVVVALDVGGSGMKCALVRRDGTVTHTEHHLTRAARGPAAVIDTILDVAEALADTARREGLAPVALGLAVPGVIDEAQGVAIWSANIGFRDVPLRKLAAARLGMPAALGHDVRVGGLAEARLGAGRSARHVLFVAIGTGIAAAHVIDGAAAAGAHGAAGEFGHVLVRPGGPRCGCGRDGCLEAVASASAVARRYAELASTAPDAPEASAAEVATHAPPVDPAGPAGLDGRGRGTRRRLATGQALFDVEAVVLGGGLARAGAQLLDPLRAALHDRMTFHREPRLVPAALGAEAGCLGAALLALDDLEKP
ncbi:ROK family protein [Salinispora arenicola]|nr:ROK family protein [Salinispora arenicola]